MIIIYNENTSIGKKQLSFLKEVYQDIRYINIKQELLEIINQKKIKLILIDGISFANIFKELKVYKNISFLIFPPYSNRFYFENKEINILEKKNPINKFKLYDQELKNIFFNDKVKESDIQFFYTSIFEQNDQLKTIIIDGNSNIFVKVINIHPKSIVYLTTIIVDQFSIMNDTNYIKHIHQYINDKYKKLKEETLYNKKQKALIQKEKYFTLKNTLYNLVLLSLLYYIKENKQDYLIKHIFMQILKDINDQLRLNINLKKIKEEEILNIVQQKGLIKYDKENLLILKDYVLNEINKHHLMSIYRRMKVNK